MLSEPGTSSGITGVGQFCCRSERKHALKLGGKAEIAVSSAQTKVQMELNINIAVI